MGTEMSYRTTPITLEQAAADIQRIEQEAHHPIGSWAHSNQWERLITANRVYIELRNELAAQRITADDIALDDELAKRRLDRRARERLEFSELFTGLGRVAR